MLGKRNSEHKDSGNPRKTIRNIKLETIKKMGELEGAYGRANPLEYKDPEDETKQLDFIGGYLACTRPQQHGRIAELLAGLVESTKIGRDNFIGPDNTDRLDEDQSKWKFQLDATLILYSDTQKKADICAQLKAINPGLSIAHIDQFDDIFWWSLKEIADFDIILVPHGAEVQKGNWNLENIPRASTLKGLEPPYSRGEINLVDRSELERFDWFIWKRLFVLYDSNTDRMTRHLPPPVANFTWMVYDARAIYEPRRNEGIIRFSCGTVVEYDYDLKYNWTCNGDLTKSQMASLHQFVCNQAAVRFDEGNCGITEENVENLDTLMGDESVRYPYDIVLKKALERFSGDRMLFIVKREEHRDQILQKIAENREESDKSGNVNLGTNGVLEMRHSNICVVTLEELDLKYQYYDLLHVICAFYPTQDFIDKYMIYLGNHDTGFPNVWYLFMGRIY